MTNQIIKTEGRIEVADVLRGIAVMGIIMLHCIEHFNFYSFPDTTNDSQWLKFSDRAIWDGLFFTFAGKSYAIFSLLFGFSFFIQDNNQKNRGKDFRARFCWRLLLLFIIGNFNAAFFTAEVLVLYSIVGFVFVLTCRLSDKWVFIIASILLIQPLPVYYLISALVNPEFALPEIPTAQLWAEAYNVQNSGTFLETVKVNLWEGQLASLAWAWDNGRVFQSAALFLFGMLIGRKGLFIGTEENLKKWGKILAIALLAFFPLYGLSNMLPKYIETTNIVVPLKLIVNSLANFSFMIVIVSAIIFAYYRSNIKTLLQKFVPYGKMSLTNYIMQSIVGSMLFYNWGFGLHDKLGITASALVGVLFFLAQLAFCRWWMNSHKHGPVEYLWKKATWLK